MFKYLRSLGLSAGLLLAACGGAAYDDNPPTDLPPDDPPGNVGNVWIIGQTSVCTNYEGLAMLSEIYCEPYKAKPVVLEYGPACLEWHFGIGGPYSFPGAEWMKFQCEIR